MGFINTEHKQTIDSLTQGFKDKMKNPYYLFNDKSPSTVTYYTINKEMSTLDQGLKTVDSNIGSNSPLRFNKINNFFLYGIERIELSLNMDEFGLSSDSITGEALVLPGTIVPVPGEYFIIHHLNNDYLFKVISMNKDTLESGANFYKLEYKYDDINNNNIDKYVIDQYETIVNNVGTDFKMIVKSTDYKLVDLLEKVNEQFKEYFNVIFYKDRVDSFILYHNGTYLYDPCLTEFLIRNDILHGNTYKYVTQQLSLPSTFVLEYDKSIFRAIELKDYEKLEKSQIFISIENINQPLSLLTMRREKYYKIQYQPSPMVPITVKMEQGTRPYPLIPIIETDILPNIRNEVYTNTIEDIIVKFFNDKPISSDDIDILENIQYENSMYLFYRMPLIIYILNTYIKQMLKK